MWFMGAPLCILLHLSSTSEVIQRGIISDCKQLSHKVQLNEEKNIQDKQNGDGPWQIQCTCITFWCLCPNGYIYCDRYYLCSAHEQPMSMHVDILLAFFPTCSLCCKPNHFVVFNTTKSRRLILF